MIELASGTQNSSICGTHRNTLVIYETEKMMVKMESQMLHIWNKESSIDVIISEKKIDTKGNSLKIFTKGKGRNFKMKRVSVRNLLMKMFRSLIT